MDARSPRYRAVLFDFFGTLTRAVRRGPDQERLARSFGCEPEAYFAVLDRTFYARASGRYGSPAEGLRRLFTCLGVTLDDAQLAEALLSRITSVRADGPLRPDATAVLRALRRRGMRTGVVSDCWYELPLFFPELPVAPLLDATIFSIDVGHCKPHPAMYLYAAARLGLEPSECIYVGDGGSRELSGACAVGMTAVGLAAADLSDHLVFHAEPDWRGPQVESLTEVVELVDVLPALVR